MLRALGDGPCPICEHVDAPGPPRTVVADPPWQFDDKLPGDSRGAEKNYRVLTVDDICRLRLPPLAADCHLFLWRVASMVEEAYRVVRAWGFTPKSEVVWHKLTSGGKRWFGMGRHVRAEHEVAIIAVRGSPKVRDRATRSIVDVPEPLGFDAKYTAHSAKPDEFFALVETLCSGPYLEMFARRQRPGWACVGDEVGAPLEVMK